MKLLKLSLATLIALGTSAVAADTLSDAFTNGTFSGELKSYYFDRNHNNGATDESTIFLGVQLHYETADFYGVKLGVGSQTSAAPWASEDDKSAFKKDMYGSGTVLSEAYLEYSLSKTTMKLGRQYIHQPMMKGSPSRMVYQAFQGLTVESKDIPQTTAYLAYVNKYQDRTDEDYNVGRFEDLGTDVDYGYAASIKNISIPNTTLSLGYGELDNSYDITYLEAIYKGKTDSFNYLAGAQYHMTGYDSSVSTEDASYYGVKVGVGIGGFSTYVAYSDQDGTSKYKIVGDGTKPTIFTTALIDAGQYGESEQYAIDAKYNFKELGLTLGARYVDIDTPTDTNSVKTLYSNYHFSGALKDLMARVWYEEKEKTWNGPAYEKLWVKLDYKFSSK
jgi:hypothetical protein